MVKKTILLLPFILSAITTVSAQTERVYLDDKGKRAGKSKAVSYMIYKKIADTTWGMQKFDMRDTILERGAYKDSTLKIPDGHFFYYTKLKAVKLRTPFVEASEMDTLNHLTESGVFKNGLKNGPWVKYYPNGNPEFVKTYINDIPNGPYESYTYDTNSVLMKGNYVNGLKEGEWRLYNPVGELIQTTIFLHSYISHTQFFSPTYKKSQPSGEFYAFIADHVARIAGNEKQINIIFRSHVTTEGKLENAEITSGGLKEAFKKQLLHLIATSPAWIPGTKGNPAQPIEDVATFVIKIADGDVTTEYLDLNAILKGTKH